MHYSNFGSDKKEILVPICKDDIDNDGSQIILNTIRIYSSENKQQPGASRSGQSQGEEAKLGSTVEKMENFNTFFFIEGFP